MMYVRLVQAGIGVPSSPMLVELCTLFRIAPLQMTPIFLRKWASFVKLCDVGRVRYSLTALRCVYRMKLVGSTACLIDRSFEFKGEAATDRGAVMKWRKASTFKGTTTSGTKFRKSYFLYRGAELTWAIDPTGRPDPTLEDLSDEDIRCLQFFCKSQTDGEPLVLSESDLGESELERLGFRRAPLEVRDPFSFGPS